VLKTISSQAEAVLKPESNLSSLEPSDYKNVSAVDKLAVKLFQEHQRFLDRVEADMAEEAAQQQKKRYVQLSCSSSSWTQSSKCLK
jgi:hypothetical protein